MALERRPLGPLAASGSTRIFRDWLSSGVRTADDVEVRTAAGELEAALDSELTSLADPRPAPLFTSGWNGLVAGGTSREVYLDAAVMEHCEPESHLLEGWCDVVVTGQQPGWLGGPLYTLYKVATAIALAERRTRAGRRTIPVFWSADDDDDHAEAFEPRCWIPGRAGLERAEPPQRGKGSDRPRPVGDLRIGEHDGQAGSWLDRIVGEARTEAQRFLSTRRETWWVEGRSWGKAQEIFLRMFFGRQDLVVVSGNDPRVHAAAGPLYERLIAEQGDLSKLARERGAALEAGGWHAQLSGRSLARPLFRMRDGRREHWESTTGPVEASELRPGVMLRALVQDWLVRPAAVIAGPGELAYLRQLDPLYERMGIRRPPIVPRLSGWIVPDGFDAGALLASADPGPAAGDIDAWADRAAGAAQRELAAILTRELEIDPKRAEELAAGRARRYRKGVHSLLGAEAARRFEEMIPREPAWVFPEGGRQERRLASMCAAAIWGEELAEAMVAAAHEHLDRGLRGDWSEFLFEVK